MTPLRRKMREDMQIRNYAPATQKGYLWRVGQFARHYRRSPDRLGLKEIHKYQVHLVEKGADCGTMSQVVSALRFFYGVTLDKKWVIEKIPYPKKERRLPEIPTREQLLRFLNAIPTSSTAPSSPPATPAGCASARSCACGGRYRQRADAHPGPQGQGPPGSPGPVVTDVAAAPARLLPCATPRRLALPGHARRRADLSSCRGERLPEGQGTGGAQHPYHRPYPAPQLRHAPARLRRQHPDHPGPARPSQHQHDGAVHACVADGTPRHGESARLAHLETLSPGPVDGSPPLGGGRHRAASRG